MYKTEYLRNETLQNKYIMKSFTPFYVIKILLGTSRIHFRDKFVTSPTSGQKIYSSLIALITLVLYVYIDTFYFIRFNNYGSMYYICISCTIVYYIIFLCNIIHVRFMNSNSNPKFYLQLQELDRLMKFEKGSRIYKYQFINNMFSITLFFISIVGSFYVTTHHENYDVILGLSGLLYSSIACTIEWTYCADLLVHFLLRTWFINAIIINHLRGKPRAPKSMSFPTAKVIRFIASSYDLKSHPTDIYLKVLMDSFVAFQNLYRFQICLFCVKFVLLSLLAFQAGITAVQYNSLQSSQFLALPLILTMNVGMVLVICIRCELFFRSVKKTRRLSISLLARYHDGPLREKVKKMLNITQEQPGNFNVYNMWNMNATTIISMLNIVTTMMIALLQFAYL